MTGRVTERVGAAWRMTRWMGLVAIGVLACRPAAPARPAAVARTALAPAGDVIAVAEAGDALYLVAPDRVTIERGGRAVMTVPAPDGRWAEAVTMPALDDRGAASPATWVVARTTTGGLWRITLAGELEPIHDRLGLPPRVRAIAADAATIGIALDDEVAILRDRTHVARFSTEALGMRGAPGPVVATGGRIALRRGAHLDVWSLADLTHVDYTIPGALAAAFLEPRGHGTLVVATPAALFIEAAGGLRRVPAPAELRELAVAGSRLWVATAREVFLVDDHTFVRTGVEAAAADHLFGLANGDLLLAGPAGIARLSIDHTSDHTSDHAEADSRWIAVVEPIVLRVCAKCHRPGGSAGIDLSTPAAWRAEHAELVHRVVETRTMPPAGTELGEADRRVLAEFLLH